MKLAFILLFILFYFVGFSQNKDARTNALGGCGLTQTTYTDRMVLKSGWDEIEGNKMTEIKVQLRYKF